MGRGWDDVYKDQEQQEAEEEYEDEIGPDDPDWDLSEAHGYMWEPEREEWPLPRSVLVPVAILLVISLVLPGLLILFRYA